MSRNHQAAGVHVWQYQLDRAAPDANGVVRHGAELPFVLDGISVVGPVVVTAVEPAKPRLTPAVALQTQPAVLQAQPLAPVTLQAYWVRFAMTGDPNGPGLPRWPEYGSKREYLEFTEGGPVAKQNLRGAYCDLLSQP
jgi:para-nitrobenzyl esterase